MGHNGDATNDSNCDSGWKVAESDLMGEKEVTEKAAGNNVMGQNGTQRMNATRNGKFSCMPFVNLFRNNRLANENHKLDYIPPGSEMLKFSYDDIDSVESTFGMCLLGMWSVADPQQLLL